MQKQGFLNCTPENVHEYDDYWITASLIMHEVENDPNIAKAREQVAKTASGKPKRTSANTGRRTSTGNTLDLVE